MKEEFPKLKAYTGEPSGSAIPDVEALNNLIETHAVHALAATADEKAAAKWIVLRQADNGHWQPQYYMKPHRGAEFSARKIIQLSNRHGGAMHLQKVR